MRTPVDYDKWPSWLKLAYHSLGTKEIPGKSHSPVIQGWLRVLGAWWNDDETPWCGVFVGYFVKKTGYPIPKLYMRAKAWLDWGKEVKDPVPGCVCILDRKGGGHVFFVMALTKDGDPVGIGGNQGNAVTIAAFERHRVLGYRVPVGYHSPWGTKLPVVASAAEFSTNEA